MTEHELERPNIVLQEHLEYLDDLSASNVTNMMGAGPYLESEFPGVDKYDAKVIILYWMESYDERHSDEY